MDDKYQKIIEALANKLGVTAEYLWSVLVRQAPISGAVDLVTCIVLVACSAWFIRLTVKKTTVPPTTAERKYPEAEWRGEAAMVAWLVAIGLVTITLTGILVSAQDIVSAFVNPEYWALMRLIK